MNAERIQQQIRWEHLSRAIPSVARDLLNTIDVVGIRNETTEEIESALFGWSDRRTRIRGRPVRVDQSGARATWRNALSNQRSATLNTVRLLVDDAKETAHLKKVQEHEVGDRLLPHHEAPEARDGVLVVRPPQRRFPYFGLSGYLEVTPVEIPVYVARLWQTRTGKASPTAWDLTAGANTVAEVLRTIFRAQVVASDIVTTDGLDDFGALGDLGRLPRHRAGRLLLETHPKEAVVSAPDLVFIDPPSRGRPTHTRIYDGAHPEAELASLDRLAYLHSILLAVVTAVLRLAPHGLVSLLLREGVRDHQRVTVDNALIEDALGGLAETSKVRLVERLRVEERLPVNQASLGVSRYPMTHLLFERSPS